MVRVAVDAMGGDHAPEAIVRGAVQALDDLDCQIILVGDEARIRELLPPLGAKQDRVRVVHSTQVVEMDEAPVEAIRQKRDSSLVKTVKLAAEDEADVVISAGNTGAFAAACQLKLRPLGPISRPGIAVAIPAFHGPFVLCDVGANIQTKPQHLYEYAVMASLYSERVLGVKNPRCGLMSIGEESRKGNDLVKQTHKLIAADPNLNFVGNIEGRDIFGDKADVGVCDGFVGNIVLKFIEGMAEGLFHSIGREFEDSPPDVREHAKAAIQRLWSRHDYSEYGGAPLLGVDGVCIICHGRSDDRAIRNAVRGGAQFKNTGYNEAVVSRLGVGVA
jgi:phosphate acyltransferase